MRSEWLRFCGWVRNFVHTEDTLVLTCILGFEDEDEGTAHSRPPKDPVRSEERRRTFWACFLLDRTVSDGKERPCIMKAPLPSALRMPGSDADWNAGRLSQGARFDPNPPLWSIPVNVDLSIEPEADLYGLVSETPDRCRPRADSARMVRHYASRNCGRESLDT